MRIGIDPTIAKYGSHYEKDIIKVDNFFNAEIFLKASNNKKADLITSISMFYDLPDPNQFVSHIVECLSPDGLWHLEQSYMPSMLRTNSYDTICHEHLEYYSIQTLNYLV